MNAFLSVIIFIFAILILVNPKKFGSFLGNDARIKVIIIMLLLGCLNNDLNEGRIHIHGYINVLSISWLILALKNPTQYANFLGKNLQRLKIVSIFFLIVIVQGVFIPKKENPNIATSNSKVVLTEIKEDSNNLTKESNIEQPNKKTKSKKIVHDYFHLSEKYIQEIYRTTYQSQGLGVPEVDCRYMTYRDWDIIDGKMQVSEGTFYLGGNKNIEHTYDIRWRNKTGQPLCIVINEQQYFLDKEAQMAAYDD